MEVLTFSYSYPKLKNVRSIFSLKKNCRMHFVSSKCVCNPFTIWIYDTYLTMKHAKSGNWYHLTTVNYNLVDGGYYAMHINFVSLKYCKLKRMSLCKMHVNSTALTAIYFKKQQYTKRKRTTDVSWQQEHKANHNIASLKTVIWAKGETVSNYTW